MQIKQLLTTPYQVRLDNHRPSGDFTTSVSQSGVQKAAFGNAYLCLAQHIEDGRNAPEIEVLLLIDQMYMDNLCHNSFGIFFLVNIPNNNYME